MKIAMSHKLRFCCGQRNVCSSDQSKMNEHITTIYKNEKRSKNDQGFKNNIKTHHNMIVPKVVDVKQTCLTRNRYENFRHWNSKETHIYIGRGNELMPPSKWMNPFKIGNDNRQQCIVKYEEMIRNNDELMNCLHELNNCVLGCHCFPQDCHRQVLQKLFIEKFIKNENPKHNNEIHNDVENKKRK